MNIFESVVDLCKKTLDKANQHSPELLAGVGIAGFVSTTVLAVKAKPKADILVEDKRRELNKDKLTPIETVKVIWRPYLPAIITGVASTTCIIGSVSTSVKRNAALSAAYTIATDYAKQYKQAVIETVGEKKESEIRDKMSENKVKNAPVSKEIIITGNGDSLCMDSISGRTFRSNINEIKKVINELNNTMLQDNYVSLNDFYVRIGLPCIDLGDELGWTSEKGILIDTTDFSTTLSQNGEPCLVVNFNILPAAHYDSIFA